MDRELHELRALVQKARLEREARRQARRRGRAAQAETVEPEPGDAALDTEAILSLFENLY